MIVIDANVIVKLALEEEDSADAREIMHTYLSKGEGILTVDIALAESLNALWKRNIVIKNLTDSKFDLGFSEILEFWQDLYKIPSTELALTAKNIAQKSKLTIYDAFYVSAAIQNKAPLFTFDKQIISNAEKLGIKILKPSP